VTFRMPSIRVSSENFIASGLGVELVPVTAAIPST
jgi:hypothetical protein